MRNYFLLMFGAASPLTFVFFLVIVLSTLSTQTTKKIRATPLPSGHHAINPVLTPARLSVILSKKYVSGFTDHHKISLTNKKGPTRRERKQSWLILLFGFALWQLSDFSFLNSYY